MFDWKGILYVFWTCVETALGVTNLLSAPCVFARLCARAGMWEIWIERDWFLCGAFTKKTPPTYPLYYNHYNTVVVPFIISSLSNTDPGFSSFQGSALLPLWMFLPTCFVRSCCLISSPCSKACFSILIGSSRSPASWCLGLLLRVRWGRSTVKGT